MTSQTNPQGQSTANRSGSSGGQGSCPAPGQQQSGRCQPFPHGDLLVPSVLSDLPSARPLPRGSCSDHAGSMSGHSSPCFPEEESGARGTRLPPITWRVDARARI